MSLFSKRDVSDAVAPQLLQDGEEYELTILNMEERSGEGDKGPWQCTNVRLACMNEPNSLDVYHTFWEPKADAKQSSIARLEWDMKSFLSCFSLSSDELNELEDRNWENKTGICIIKQKPRRDDPTLMECSIKVFTPKSN